MLFFCNFYHFFCIVIVAHCHSAFEARVKIISHFLSPTFSHCLRHCAHIFYVFLLSSCFLIFSLGNAQLPTMALLLRHIILTPSKLPYNCNCVTAEEIYHPVQPAWIFPFLRLLSPFFAATSLLLPAFVPRR